MTNSILAACGAVHSNEVLCFSSIWGGVGVCPLPLLGVHEGPHNFLEFLLTGSGATLWKRNFKKKCPVIYCNFIVNLEHLSSSYRYEVTCYGRIFVLKSDFF